MKTLTNVITLSNLDQQLEEWARKEARRRKKPFYQVINEAPKLYQVVHQAITEGDDDENNPATVTTKRQRLAPNHRSSFCKGDHVNHFVRFRPMSDNAVSKRDYSELDKMSRVAGYRQTALGGETMRLYDMTLHASHLPPET